MKGMKRNGLAMIDMLRKICREVLKLGEEIFINLEEMKMDLDNYKEYAILFIKVIILKVGIVINLGILKMFQETLTHWI